MSEESLKAAKWDMHIALKDERSRLHVLREKVEKIGNSLHTFGRVFANPDWVFTCEESGIVGKSTVYEGRDSSFEIPIANFNVEEIRQLLKDLVETKTRIQSLEERTKEE